MEMPLGKYVVKDSFLHRLDARFKLFAIIVLMVSVFLPYANLAMDFTYYAFLSVLVIIMMIIASVSFISLLKMLKPLTFMILFILIINLFMIKEGNAINIFNWVIYDKALYNTLYTLLRLVLTISLSLILTSVTTSMDLTYALEWYLYPLKFLRINVSVIAMIFSLALRFIPTLFEETLRIRRAQSSRGVDFENGHLKEKISAIVSLIVPLFVSAIQRSVELADSMEVRRYNPDAKRTRYRVMKFHKRDLWSFIFMLLYLAGIILIIVFKVNLYAL